MHTIIRFAAAATVLLLLAGCQSAPRPDHGRTGCEPIESGAASEAVRVSGAVLERPQVRFPDGLSANRTQRTAVEPGSGAKANDGALVTLAYAAFNGSTGEELDFVGYDNAYVQARVDDSTMLAGLAQAVRCSRAGSRVVAVVPPSGAFGSSGREKFKISRSDSVVFVVDVVAVALDRADGKSQPAVPGMPAVLPSPTGEPDIVIPAATPPQALQTAVIRNGSGAIVAEGATVTIEYRGVLWRSGDTFDSSWRRDDLVQRPTTSFIAGIGKVLVGQNVGSEVLAVIPPGLGYGDEGNPEFGINGTDTLVYVIDILAVVPLV